MTSGTENDLDDLEQWIPDNCVSYQCDQAISYVDSADIDRDGIANALDLDIDCDGLWNGDPEEKNIDGDKHRDGTDNDADQDGEPDRCPPELDLDLY